MFTKVCGKWACMAPAGEEGAASAGSIAAAAASAGLPTPEEVQASEQLAQGEDEPGPEPVNPESAEEQPAADAGDAPAGDAPEAQPEANADLQAEVHKLEGKLELVQEANAKLHGEKADIQASLDNVNAELSTAKAACDQLKPLAMRQVQILSMNTNTPAPDMSDMSVAEIGSTGATLLAKLEKATPGNRVSQDAEPASDVPTQKDVPSTEEAGLSGL